MQKSKKQLVLEKCQGRCYYCDDGFTNWHEFGLDHVIPKSKGGSNDIENLVLACNICNRYKSDLSIETFYQRTVSRLSEAELMRSRCLKIIVHSNQYLNKNAES